MKLSEAQRLSRQLREAEKEFDASWNQRWRAIVARGVMLALPVSLAAGFVSQAIFGPVSPDASLIPFVFWGTWGASGVGLAAAGPLLRERAKRQQGMETTDARVLQACESLQDLPPEVTEPLERSLDAYLHISRVAEDPVWRGSGVSMRESVDQAGQQLIALLDWGRRLSEVARTVSRLSGRPGGEEVQAQYHSQLARLEAAAGAYQDVEARVARAYVALSGAAPGQTVSPDELSGLGASFDALAEVLSASESVVSPSERRMQSEESAPLPLRRG